MHVHIVCMYVCVCMYQNSKGTFILFKSTFWFSFSQAMLCFWPLVVPAVPVYVYTCEIVCAFVEECVCCRGFVNVLNHKTVN